MSTLAASPTLAGVPDPTQDTSGTAPTVGTGIHSSTAPSAAPSHVSLVERPISDNAWPMSLKLRITDCNWTEWSKCLSLLVDHLYILDYLDSSLICPDAAMDAHNHHIWKRTDKSLRALILEHLSPNDYDIAVTKSTSYHIFEVLCAHHELLELHAQLNLLMHAFSIQYTPGIPLSTMSKELGDIHVRIVKMGKFDNDKLLIILIINALTTNYGALQSLVHSMTDNQSFSSSTALKQIDMESTLEQQHTENGGQGGIALMATLLTVATKEKDKLPKNTCSNCKKPYHTADFCVALGGKMFGKLLEDAKATQCAAFRKPPQTNGRTNSQVSSANIAMTNPPNPTVSGPISAVPAQATNPALFIINSMPYILVPAPSLVTGTQANLCDHNGAVRDLIDFYAFMALNDLTALTNVDWDDFDWSIPGPLGNDTGLTATKAQAYMPFKDSPFVLDMGLLVISCLINLILTL